MILLNAVGGVLKLAEKALGGLGISPGELIDKIKTSADNDPELKRALINQEIELKKLAVQDSADARELIEKAMKSEDPYIRRARPTLLWIGHVIILFKFLIFPLVTVFTGNVIGLPLPQEFYWLYGSGFLGYGALRTAEKKGKNPLGTLSKFLK